MNNLKELDDNDILLIKKTYDFVSQKINILQIYTKAEFERNYPADVVQHYYYMLNFVNNPNNSDNKIHIGIIKNKIIDMLYDYIIINNK